MSQNKEKNSATLLLVNRFDAPAGHIAIARSATQCEACDLLETCSPYPCHAEDRRDSRSVIFKVAKHFAILASYEDSAGRRFKHMYRPIAAENKRGAITATLTHLKKSYRNVEILGAWSLS
jgi:hypothetical protein